MQSYFYKVSDNIERNQLYIMREDLLPVAGGGNKVRIAKEFLQDMKDKKCNVMIGYGNSSSNLCRVLANLCCQEHIPCYIICSGTERNIQETSNSRMIALSGAGLIYCHQTEIADTVETLMNKLRKEGKKPYYIYGNKYGTGNKGVAVKAYAGAYDQILSYQKEKCICFDYIFFPSGTGATQGGLTSGHILAKDKTKICGILISSRGYPRAFSVIQQEIRAYMANREMEYQECFDEEIHLLGDYTQGGYGIYDKDILNCIRKVFRDTGVPLDPVYTGKAFWGMQQYLKEKNIQGKKLLFVHTGGTPLFYDCLNRGELYGKQGEEKESRL